MAKFKGAIKECVVCGVAFKVPQCRSETAKACSTECSYKDRMRHRIIERVKMNCTECGKEFTEHQCHASRRTFCSKACGDKSAGLKGKRSANTSGAMNPGWLGGVSVAAVSATGKPYLRISPAKENAKSAKRKSQQLQATPRWADPVLILAFYEESQRLTLATGIVHHVDHQVPLQSKYVCGLHTQDNLCVMVGADNISKSNRSWLDMP